jgi:two-component system LytT family response regulator
VRILIVDDEPLARALLTEQLAGIPLTEVVGQAADGYEAVKLAEQLAPDVMLLDVQMPKLSGFEVLELLGARSPAVIFVTAFDEFALRAFEVHAVDYLLKPVERERLAAALDRAADRLRGAARPPSAHELAESARPPGRPLTRVVIRDGAHVHVVPVERIDFIEAQDDYVSFASGGKRLRKQLTLAQVERQLDPTRFVRVHRSYVLNLERLARIEPYSKDSWLVILSDGSRLPMSRSGYERLRELMT